MNALLTFALLRRSEKGFALPLALMIGLILIGTGITMLSRSQGDQSKITAQKIRAEGLTGTEAGLARVQDYLNTVRFIATLPSQCSSPTDDNCWAGATIPEEGTNPTTDVQKQLVTLRTATTCDVSSKDKTKTASDDRISDKIGAMREILVDGDGKDDIIDPKEAEKQKRFLDYRIVGYTFTFAASDNLNLIGQGILTLEGRSGKTDSTSVKTVVDNAESSNRLVVSIPVYPSHPVAFNRTTTAPALWITSGTIEDTKSKFQGDVVMSDGDALKDDSYTKRGELECSLNTGDKAKIEPSSGVTPPYRAQFFNRPPYPSSSYSKLKQPETPEIPTDIPTGQRDIEINDTETFPRKGDTETTRNGKTVYEYRVKSIDLKGNSVVTITPGEKVIFYVEGNIKTEGDGGLRHVCPTTPSPSPSATPSPTPSEPACNASNFLIIAYNASKAPNPEICLKDKGDLEAFILAPGYELGIQKNGSGKFTGSMWGGSWGKDCSDNNQIAIIQGANWSNLVYNFKPDRLKELPQIGRVLTWCEEAVGTNKTETKCAPSMPGSSTTSSPTTGTSEGTPTTGTLGGTPTMGTSEGTPTTDTSKEKNTKTMDTPKEKGTN